MRRSRGLRGECPEGVPRFRRNQRHKAPTRTALVRSRPYGAPRLWEEQRLGEPPVGSGSDLAVSIEAFHWALRVPVGGNAKVVLLGLANHAHPDGTEAYPSLDTLAEYAHCDRSTARRNVRKLVADGWITEDGIGPKGQTKYRVRVEIPSPKRGGGVLPRGDGTGAQGGMAPVLPEPSIEPSIEEEPLRSPLDRIPELVKRWPMYREPLEAIAAVAEAKKSRSAWNPNLIPGICDKYRDRDLDVEAAAFRSYWIEGMGENRPVANPVATWRGWVTRAPTKETRRRARGGKEAARDERQEARLARIREAREKETA